MSTTDDDTTANRPSITNLPDAVDRDRLERDLELYGEYRSLYRLSPSNEADACETAAEVRAAITRETHRDNPRDWVVARLNKKLEEVRADA